jgi:hypothetical protein
MAHGSHICYENYEFISIKRPTPVSALSRSLDLRPEDPDPVAHGEHTLETTLGGCIPEFTNVGGLIPSPITSQGQDFHPGSQRPMAHGELARGMARGGHILLGNHEIARTNGSTPVTSSYPV